MCPCLCIPALISSSGWPSILHAATHSLHPHHDPVTTTESYRSGLYRMKSFWKPSVLLILVYNGLCAIGLLNLGAGCQALRVNGELWREGGEKASRDCPKAPLGHPRTTAAVSDVINASIAIQAVPSPHSTGIHKHTWIVYKNEKIRIIWKGYGCTGRQARKGRGS